MGISSGRWDAQLWRDNLARNGRIAHVCAAYIIAQNDEAIFPYEGQPFHTFEASFVMALFCVRRLSEKRLLTDALDARRFRFTTYPAKEEVRQPLASQTSNEFYHNYHFEKAEVAELTLRDFSNEVIHSSNLGLVVEPEGLPIGIVVASDQRLQHRLLHLTLSDWFDLCQTVLRDRVYMESDSWDPITGKITTKRQGRMNS